MTPFRLHRTAGAKGRAGSAMILVLLLTFALAALAGSAILLSSTATQTVKSRESEKDLRYAADAAIGIGESQIETDPTTVPLSGYTQIATNSAMLAADSSVIPHLTYNLYVGPTGSVTRQNGRFVTLIAQSMDTAHHRSFIRRVELMQETFAKFAYFSNSENGICFGSGDILYGPIFSNSLISTCGPPQVATFEDSVEVSSSAASPGFSNGNPTADSLKYGFRYPVAPIPLPSTAHLASLFTLAATGSTLFTSPNTNTDSTGNLHSRLEFDAYNDSNPTLGADSIASGQGFVKFYQIDETNTYWTTNFASGTKRDSAAAAYLRAGLNKRGDWHNCGDWHYVLDSSAKIAGATSPYHWEFFPEAVHDSGWFKTAVTTSPYSWTDGNGNIYRFASPYLPTVAGLDSNFMILENAAHSWLHNYPTVASTNSEWKYVKAGTLGSSGNQVLTITPRRDAQSPNPVCYLGGDPHLVSMERTGWKNTVSTRGYGWRGGVDSTFTYASGGPAPTIPALAGLGHWVVWPGTAISWANTNFKGNHADWAALFPIDTTLNPGFKGVVGVHGSTGVSGNVDGHITLYIDGQVGMIDNLRLTTDQGDSTCEHGMGIVSSQSILATDNAVNVPQHWNLNDPSGTLDSNWVTLRDNNSGGNGTSTFGGSLYVESTVMALNSWGAEGLTADSAYTSSVLCATSAPPDNIYKRGCLYVFGSIIQNSRVTVNSGSGGAGGYGYAKRYQYDICAVTNPLPYFPTTGRLIENKYYEHDPNHFNVAALYQSLQGP